MGRRPEIRGFETSGFYGFAPLVPLEDEVGESPMRGS